MSAGEYRPRGHEAVDAATANWRQGDCVLGEEWFIVRGNAADSSPVPDEAEVLEDQVAGLAVVTQTCDIVRSCTDRPYVEVSPLVRSEDLDGVKAGRRPNYAYLPGVAAQGLVADLDRTMTVTKNTLAGWTRVPGCADEEDARALSRALKRKRGRFAFPDDFNALCNGLKRRLLEKHGKHSPEGTALRRLREIRIEATPSWEFDSVSLMFWFIRHEDEGAMDWNKLLQSWLDLVPPAGRFRRVEGIVTSLDAMTAADYVNSERLDLDHLSRAS